MSNDFARCGKCYAPTLRTALTPKGWCAKCTAKYSKVKIPDAEAIQRALNRDRKKKIMDSLREHKKTKALSDMLREDAEIRRKAAQKAADEAAETYNKHRKKASSSKRKAMDDAGTVTNSIKSIIRKPEPGSKSERLVKRTHEDIAKEAAEKAKQELAQRELMRRRLLPYVLRFNPGYQAGWLHKVLCKELEEFSKAVAEGRSPRLILQVPPRHGKTQLASIELPSWHLGHYPDHDVICASHTASLAYKNSRAVRNRLLDPAYHTVFETRLAKDSQAVDQWNTTAGGGLKAVGVGGAVVGSGAHLLLIDDPITGIAQAESSGELQKVIEWYQTEAYTRLAPGGGVCIIMQRWHENDLAGHLISQADKDPYADKFRVVHFPAIAEHDEPHRKKGEALHPERFSLEQLLRIKATLTPRQWNAIYQQNPIPEDGSYFTTDMFRFYRPDDIPVEMRVVSCWDLAIGQSTTNDYSVGVVAGLAPSGYIYILDVRRGRWDSFELVTQMLDQQRQFGVEIMGIEKGQIELTLMPLLQRIRAERNQWDFTIERLKVGRQDKLARARTIQGRMQQGRVLFDEYAPWFADLQSEMLRFPDGKHDDQVDAMAHVGQLLTQLPPPSPPKQQQPRSWLDKLRARSSSARRGSYMSA